MHGCAVVWGNMHWKVHEGNSMLVYVSMDKELIGKGILGAPWCWCLWSVQRSSSGGSKGRLGTGGGVRAKTLGGGLGLSRPEMEVTKGVHGGWTHPWPVSSLWGYLLSVLLLRFRFKTRKWTSPRSPPSVGPKQISSTSLVSGPAYCAETPWGSWPFRGHLSGLLTVTDFMTSLSQKSTSTPWKNNNKKTKMSEPVLEWGIKVHATWRPNLPSPECT